LVFLCEHNFHSCTLLWSTRFCGEVVWMLDLSIRIQSIHLMYIFCFRLTIFFYTISVSCLEIQIFSEIRQKKIVNSGCTMTTCKHGEIQWNPLFCAFCTCCFLSFNHFLNVKTNNRGRTDILCNSDPSVSGRETLGD